VTKGIRSFTTTPFAFTGIDRARAYTGVSPDKASYFLVRVAPDSNVESVRRRLQPNLSEVEVLTTTEFSQSQPELLAVRHRCGKPPCSLAPCSASSSAPSLSHKHYLEHQGPPGRFATLRPNRMSGR